MTWSRSSFVLPPWPLAEGARGTTPRQGRAPGCAALPRATLTFADQPYDQGPRVGDSSIHLSSEPLVHQCISRSVARHTEQATNLSCCVCSPNFCQYLSISVSINQSASMYPSVSPSIDSHFLYLSISICRSPSVHVTPSMFTGLCLRVYVFCLCVFHACLSTFLCLRLSVYA